MTTAPSEKTVDAAFDIVDWQEAPYDEPADGPRLTRITITKRYRGAIEGSGVAEVLTAQGDDGSGDLASERIIGTLDGREGTFVIQHVADGSEQSTFGTVIPHSGTGELAGLRGHATEGRHGVLSLAYTI